MSIERDEFGVPKFTDRDGAKRYRVEFTVEEGNSSGVDYVDNLADLDGEIISNVYELRIETPFMHEARVKATKPSDYRSLLFNMTTPEIEADIVMSGGKYKDEWLEAMALELKIRDLVGDL